MFVHTHLNTAQHSAMSLGSDPNVALAAQDQLVNHVGSIAASFTHHVNSIANGEFLVKPLG